VWSEKWTNSEWITSSNSKNSPIVIFRGKWMAPGGPGAKYAKPAQLRFPFAPERSFSFNH
jgi:hypothetical protein